MSWQGFNTLVWDAERLHTAAADAAGVALWS